MQCCILDDAAAMPKCIKILPLKGLHFHLLVQTVSEFSSSFLLYSHCLQNRHERALLEAK